MYRNQNHFLFFLFLFIAFLTLSNQKSYSLLLMEFHYHSSMADHLVHTNIQNHISCKGSLNVLLPYSHVFWTSHARTLHCQLLSFALYPKELYLPLSSFSPFHTNCKLNWHSIILRYLKYSICLPNPGGLCHLDDNPTIKMEKYANNKTRHLLNIFEN